MAETLMQTPDPRTPRANPASGGFDALLARLLPQAPTSAVAMIGPIAVAPPGDPEETDDVVDDDLDDDEDDDIDDEDDDEDFDDDDDEDEAEPEEAADEEA